MELTFEMEADTLSLSLRASCFFSSFAVIVTRLLNFLCLYPPRIPPSSVLFSQTNWVLSWVIGTNLHLLHCLNSIIVNINREDKWNC